MQKNVAFAKYINTVASLVIATSGVFILLGMIAAGIVKEWLPASLAAEGANVLNKIAALSLIPTLIGILFGVAAIFIDDNKNFARAGLMLNIVVAIILLLILLSI